MARIPEHDSLTEKVFGDPGPVSAAPGPACVDAETLAAYLDGGLSDAPRSAVEGHAAGCLRCQTLLSVVVATEPEAAPRQRWWAAWSARWLVPAAVWLLR